MTLEELAKHWGVSLAEAQRISDFMNTNYSLEVRHVPQKGWRWTMYAYDPHNKYILMDPEEIFPTPEDAIQTAQGKKLSDGQAALMGVPTDARLALTPKIQGISKTKRSPFPINSSKER